MHGIMCVLCAWNYVCAVHLRRGEMGAAEAGVVLVAAGTTMAPRGRAGGGAPRAPCGADRRGQCSVHCDRPLARALFIRSDFDYNIYSDEHPLKPKHPRRDARCMRDVQREHLASRILYVFGFTHTPSTNNLLTLHSCIANDARMTRPDITQGLPRALHAVHAHRTAALAPRLDAALLAYGSVLGLSSKMLPFEGWTQKWIW